MSHTYNTSSTFGSFFKSQPVEVYINDSPTPHYLHRENLCAKSEYFRQCLSSGFREASFGKVHLRDDEYQDDLLPGRFSSNVSLPSSLSGWHSQNHILRDAFTHFIDFVYNGMYHTDGASLRMKHISQKPINDDNERARLGAMLDAKAVTHAKVYVLAERFLVPELKTIAADKLQRNFDASYMNSNPHYYVNTDRLNKTVKLSPKAVAEVARLVYSNTYVVIERGTPESGQAGTGDSGGGRKDRMRTMVAKYVASVITSVRGAEEVMRCFEEIPEFMRDVFAFVSDAPR